ncbi:MAG: hypothetical protein P8078_12680 [bacterium]
MVAEMPRAKQYNKELLQWFENAKDVITNVRKIKSDLGIKLSENKKLTIRPINYNSEFDSVICKLANVDIYLETKESVTTSTSGNPSISHGYFNNCAQYFLQILEIDDINKQADKNKLEKEKLEQELKYNHGFLQSVMKKLENEKFVNNAPKQVVEIEKKKKADAEMKIKALENRLSKLH